MSSRRAFLFAGLGLSAAALTLPVISDGAITGARPAPPDRRVNSPYPPTIVATMVDGAAKSLPDAQSCLRFTYEARRSPYARSAPETIANALVGKLKQMRAG